MKESAEFFLLFSGLILLLGAKAKLEQLIMQHNSFGLKDLAFSPGKNGKIGQILSNSSRIMNVNSILHSHMATSFGTLLSPVAALGINGKQKSLMAAVPAPVRVSLKLVVATGNIALFSAFVVFGN